MTDGTIDLALRMLSYEDTPLASMQEAVMLINKAKGWYDTERTFGDDMALLHSEVSEAFEAYRAHGTEDVTAYDLESTPPKPEGVGSELADVLVRLLDTCERYEIDLEAEFKRKVRYNAIRDYRHGNRLV